MPTVLDGKTKRELVQLLSEVFPSRGDIARLTDFALGRPLSAIPTEGNDTPSLVLGVINWCLIQGGDALGKLLGEALDERPQRTDLRDMVVHLSDQVDLAGLVMRLFADSLSNYPPDVAKAIRICYANEGGLRSPLGSPKWAQPNRAGQVISKRRTTGYRCQFTKGSIYWSELGGAQPIWGSIGELYGHLGGRGGELGLPLTDDRPCAPSSWATEGSYQRFEGKWNDYPQDLGNDHYPRGAGATIYWSEKYGAHVTWGRIGVLYERLGGTGSLLGFPISPEEDATESPYGTTGRVQQFEGGIVHWCKQYDAVPVVGLILALYREMDGSRSFLGFPILAEVHMPPVSDYELRQSFEGGYIIVENGQAKAKRTRVLI